VPSYLLQEDGFKITLEDASGFILLEQDFDNPTRVTQVPVEVIVSPVPDARVTQVAVEVIMQNVYETVDVTIIDFQVPDALP
jgi:hypothetical protein